MSTLEVAADTRELTLSQAVNEAFREELRRDPTVFVIGEDVAEAGTPFKVLSGLVEEFGTERVIDSPISEPGITGLGLGAAITGMRPVVDIMFGDFLTLIMDQVVNQAAKIHYMSGGSLKAPLTVRTTLGATRRSAAQHSQSLHAWVAHIPGLKVALPATPYDAKGLYKTAIRCTLWRRRRAASSSSTRATRATARRPSSPPSSGKARSGISTPPCAGSARWTCRSPSRPRSKTKPCPPPSASCKPRSNSSER